MTSNDTNDRLPGSEQVSQAYRGADFDEVPPAGVDRAILEAARQEHPHRRPTYLPTLAIAATIVLSMSLLFRVGVLNERAEIFSEPARAPTAGTPSATSIELDENALREEAVTSQDSATFSDDTLATDELERFVLPQEESAAVDNAFEIAPPATPPASELRARQAQPEMLEELTQDQQAAEPAALESINAVAGAATLANTACTTTDREDAERWRECITAILATGSTDTAREEFGAFREAHPDYVLPEDLEAILEP